MRKMQRESFDDIFDQMQKLFNEFQNRGRDVTEDLAGMARGMPVDVHEEDGELIVKADMPGVEKEDINLKADGEKIEISAETTHEVKEENEKYFRQERASRSYRRSLMWPKEIDPETITANYEDGVLTVTAEKEESTDNSIDIE